MLIFRNFKFNTVIADELMNFLLMESFFHQITVISSSDEMKSDQAWDLDGRIGPVIGRLAQKKKPKIGQIRTF